MSGPMISNAPGKSCVDLIVLQLRNVPRGWVNTMCKCFMICSSSGTDPESPGCVPAETTKTSFSPFEMDLATRSDDTK